MRLAQALIVACIVQAGWATAETAAADDLPVPFAIDATQSDPGRATRPWYVTYSGPLIDTHAHLDPPHGRRPSDVGEVFVAAAKADVALIVLMPTPNEGRSVTASAAAQQRETLRQRSDGHVISLCGAEYLSQWMNFAAQYGRVPDDVDARMAQLTGDLKSGACSGVGEIALRHYDKTGRQPVINLPAAYPPLLAIAQTAARNDVWLDLHAEPVEPDGTPHQAEVFGTVARLFAQAPGLGLIYSHTAMTNVRNARALLKAFPKLMMNLKPIRNDDHWRNLEPVNNEEGHFYEDWAALFEEMPDRFMIGTDFKFHRKEGGIEKYAKSVRHVRRLLGSLKPDTVRLIAYVNAERVFRLSGPR